MALFRATSNPRLAPKLEAAYRQFGVSAESGTVPAPTGKTLSLRQGAVREAVIGVIMESDVVLSTLEIQRRVVARLGRPVKRHTVDTRLYDIVADPTSPIAKVGPARYARTDGDGAGISRVDVELQVGAVVEQVLAVLESAPAPMRPVEIWSAVEADAGEKVSYNAVASFLSLAAKHPDISVARVKRGWYARL